MVREYRIVINHKIWGWVEHHKGTDLSDAVDVYNDLVLTPVSKRRWRSIIVYRNGEQINLGFTEKEVIE